MAEGAEPSAEGGITFSEQCWNELLMLSALHQIRVRCITIHCSLSVNLQQVRSGPVRSGPLCICPIRLQQSEAGRNRYAGLLTEYDTTVQLNLVTQ